MNICFWQDFLHLVIAIFKVIIINNTFEENQDIPVTVDNTLRKEIGIRPNRQADEQSGMVTSWNNNKTKPLAHGYPSALLLPIFSRAHLASSPGREAVPAFSFY